jgi:hypothetical protein
MTRKLGKAMDKATAAKAENELLAETDSSTR